MKDVLICIDLDFGMVGSRSCFTLTVAGRAARTLAACGILLAIGTAHAAGPQNAKAASQAPAKAVAAFDTLFQGPHAGFRAVHAKGLLLEGDFTPSGEARQVSKASHFVAPSTPVLVRFSNFSGVPNAADNDPLASPRGMAIKFELPDGGDTDIVAHSYDGFPVATPDEFVAFVTALGSADPRALTTFTAAHPAARAFVDAPKPPPVSYATETFFGVNAFAFTNDTGKVRFGRYRIVPLGGSAHLTSEQAARMPPDYLATDIAERVDEGDVSFRLDLQVADAGDPLTDGSTPWPDDRRVVTLGVLRLNHIATAGVARQRATLFTPLNLVDGIGPSDDPMLSARSRAYRISHLRRSAEATP